MDVNICIIGAGVVGLAIARQLSRNEDKIVILEKNSKFGQETSSRNSEVIHSGIYYKPGSFKARLCVRGNRLLYSYLKEKIIGHQKLGKLIINQHLNEFSDLQKLQENGKANGVKNLRIIEKEEINSLEENIRAECALYVPSTGILNSHELMKCLLNDSIDQGVDIAYNSEVVSLEKKEGYYRVEIAEDKGQTYTFNAKKIINCAGLEASNISAKVGIRDENYRIYFCKGMYFRIKSPKNKLVKRLIYPIPPKNLSGLGIHTTRELDGGLKLGPNIYYLKNNIYDYSLDESFINEFHKAAKSYLPFLEIEDMIPEMAGIRPKVQAPGERERDFIIKHEKDRGYNNFVNLIGIESPGLTSCLAIAEYVASIIK